MHHSFFELKPIKKNWLVAIATDTCQCWCGLHMYIKLLFSLIEETILKIESKEYGGEK